MSELDPYPDLFEELVRRRRAGERVVMATVVSVRGSTPRQAGARMLVLADGSIRGTIGGGLRESEIVAAAHQLLREGGARLVHVDFREGLTDGVGPLCGGTMEVFMERVDPMPRVLIVGAGHIAYYLHRFVRLLDFHTLVLDPRPEFANAERFPGATLLVEPFDRELGDLAMSPRDAIVLVSPGHLHDRKALPRALATEAGYVGMIGSKSKVASLMRELREEGFEEKQLGRVHAPIGLRIGAESPAEIALAIAAEIVATMKQKA